MVYLLSFDVGIKNLAYCELGKTHKDIIRWDILSVKETNEKVEFGEVMRRLLKLLKEMWPPSSIQSQCEHLIVLIENQPCMKNPTMKSIQMVIYTYFAMIDGVDVRLASATNKLKVARNHTKKEKKVSYGEKKKLAITLARDYVTTTESSDWLLFFERNKKKDDLSDCYLQGIYFLENES